MNVLARLKRLEASGRGIPSFPMIVKAAGSRFIIESPRALAGRVVSQRWFDASGADPVIIDNVPDNPAER
jgi:hypothetical protein